MAQFTHQATGQQFEIADVALGNAQQLHLAGLGWWERIGDEWEEINEPEKPQRAVRMMAPAGVEMPEPQEAEVRDDAESEEAQEEEAYEETEEAEGDS